MNATVKEIINNNTQVAEFNPFSAKLAEYHQRYDNVVYDLNDEAQNKQARSDRLAIGKEIAALDRTHADIKAPLLEKTRMLDSARKEIKDELLNIQGKIKSQLDAHEAKIAEHHAMLQAKIDGIEGYGNPSPDLNADQLVALLAGLRVIEIDDSFEHRKADAALAKMDAEKKLTAFIQARERFETEQAELEQLRQAEAKRAQKDREDKIRQEAELRAKVQAEEALKREREAAQQAAQMAEQAAARALKEAEERAQAAVKAERERIERERLEAAAKAEQERRADEAKKAKQNHRAKIHKAAKNSLVAAGLTEEVATHVVELVRDGLIKNIQMVY